MILSLAIAHIKNSFKRIYFPKYINIILQNFQEHNTKLKIGKNFLNFFLKIKNSAYNFLNVLKRYEKRLDKNAKKDIMNYELFSEYHIRNFLLYNEGFCQKRAFLEKCGLQFECYNSLPLLTENSTCVFETGDRRAGVFKRGDAFGKMIAV